MSYFSSRAQLEEIAAALRCYMRLPLSPDTVPGGYVERLIAHVHGGEVLGKYDFVDVINRTSRVGWQVKSTMESSPVTWKRAKIPNALKLIEQSHGSPEGLQLLGNAIIDFCNHHVRASFERYDLDMIIFSRLILHEGRQATYFERQLCTQKRTALFRAEDFSWRWSTQKQTRTKEQKQALHGLHRRTGRKWFAAHILGENQLHFSGEQTWWPAKNSPQAITFTLPDPATRLSLSELIDLLERRDSAS